MTCQIIEYGGISREVNALDIFIVATCCSLFGGSSPRQQTLLATLQENGLTDVPDQTLLRACLDSFVFLTQGHPLNHMPHTFP